MTNLLWNGQERRLRALLRLLGQTFLLLVLISLFSIPAIILGGIFVDTPAEPVSPGLEFTLGDMIAGTPVLFLLLSLASLLGITVSIWIAGRWLDRRRFADFGLYLNRRWWVDLVFGLVLGAVLMAVVFVIQLAAGWITITDTFYTPNASFFFLILVALIAFIMVGFQEELLTRGYHLRNLAEGFNHPSIGPRNALLIGYVLSSAIFGILHVFNPNSTFISTFNLFLAGLFLGFGYLLTRSLAIPIGLHITWNFFQGNVFGFPVSGNPAGPTFIAIEQGGPDLMTGGAFGPEAGLLGILAMVIGIIFIYAWVKMHHGRADLKTDLAQYSHSESTSMSR
jgi:uncharacterized protein